MPKRALILVGPPGCGKGTQGVILGSILGFRHLSSGDVFRGINKNSKLGRYITQFMERGELIPNEITIDVFNHHIDRLILERDYDPSSDILILDGLPRNRMQAEMIDEKINVIGLVLLELGDNDVIVERLRKRAEDQGRMDDSNPDIIRHRIEVYNNNLKELLEFYPKDKVIRIHGNQSPMKVHYDISGEILRLRGELSGPAIVEEA